VDAIAIQPDGKIIIGGEFDAVGSTGRSRICRLNVDGTVDTSFNAGTISSWGSFLFIGSIVVQADGKIVVGGNFNTMGGQERNYITRLNADGSLDDSFDPEADFVVYTLALQADGKILAGGIFTTLGGQPRDGIGRLNADGSLDSTFNPQATGIAKAGFYALAVQADGKIVVGGLFTSLVGQPRANIGRLNADGSLDTAFNPQVGGNVFNPYVGTLAVQADGKIVVGGRFTTLADQLRNNLGRLNANGTLDTTFNPGATDGPVDPPYTMVERLAVQADGKILVGGPNSLSRLNTDGSPDPSFNSDLTELYGMALQRDGNLLVGGLFTSINGQPRAHLGRLHPDGSVDDTFTPVASGQVNTLAVQADGKILVGGAFVDLAGAPRNNIGRLNHDGSADLSFNPGVVGTVNTLV
ncbi:MAG TPA: hypothetical protein VNM37_06770, partial [Candidatus Dormibacteraeota bacterium]|nr:hypothetical protein [Candidatus Dormibacteraeota bacterium]